MPVVAGLRMWSKSPAWLRANATRRIDASVIGVSLATCLVIMAGILPWCCPTAVMTFVIYYFKTTAANLEISARRVDDCALVGLARDRGDEKSRQNIGADELGVVRACRMLWDRFATEQKAAVGILGLRLR